MKNKFTDTKSQKKSGPKSSLNPPNFIILNSEF